MNVWYLWVQLVILCVIEMRGDQSPVKHSLVAIRLQIIMNRFVIYVLMYLIKPPDDVHDSAIELQIIERIGLSPRCRSKTPARTYSRKLSDTAGIAESNRQTAAI